MLSRTSLKAASGERAVTKDDAVEGGRAASDAGTLLLVLPWSLDVVGGVNQVVLNLYRQFERTGRLRPRVLIPEWSARKPIEEIHQSGVRVTRQRLRPVFADGNLALELLRYAVLLPVEMLKIARLTRRHGVRVVNCHFINFDVIVWSLARALGVFRGSVLVSMHGLDIRTLQQLRGVRRHLWRRALEAADAVIACSKGLADETIASFGLSGSNVVTIHNGVSADRLKELSAVRADPATAAPSRPHLVNLGTFEHKKGHDLLLRAFARVLKRFPQAHLSILGRPAGALESSRALVRDLGIQDRVTLRVNVPHDEALLVLRQADVFVLPSRNEAFSVALLEAGAMARPVVAADVCGVPELIENGRTGVLVPPENVEAIAAAILHLLQNGQTARTLGQQLQLRVLESFTAETTFEQYSRLIDSVSRG